MILNRLIFNFIITVFRDVHVQTLAQIPFSPISLTTHFIFYSTESSLFFFPVQSSGSTTTWLESGLAIDTSFFPSRWNRKFSSLDYSRDPSNSLQLHRIHWAHIDFSVLPAARIPFFPSSSSMDVKRVRNNVWIRSLRRFTTLSLELRSVQK